MNGKLFITSLPTPITHTVLPLLAANTAVQILLSTPVHSSTVSGAKYSLSSSFNPSASRPSKNNRLTPSAFALASFSLSTRYVRTPGTYLSANANRPSTKSVTTRGHAPLARAAFSANNPIGPAPHTNAARPKLSGAVAMPCITTLSGSSKAPSAKLTASGSLWHQAAGWVLKRCSVPSCG